MELDLNPNVFVYVPVLDKSVHPAWFGNVTDFGWTASLVTFPSSSQDTYICPMEVKY